MNFTGPLRLKAVEFRTTEAGTESEYAVTFATAGVPEGVADITIRLAVGIVPETDLIVEGRARCHALLTRLASETQNWARPKG